MVSRVEFNKGEVDQLLMSRPRGAGGGGEEVVVGVYREGGVKSLEYSKTWSGGRSLKRIMFRISKREKNVFPKKAGNLYCPHVSPGIDQVCFVLQISWRTLHLFFIDFFAKKKMSQSLSREKERKVYQDEPKPHA